ncbi:sodium:solute symporter family transporter [Metalysinibacillus jejuensis]|uniref:sodium:solute symporter family transporter n=1 Tax=Metalysinibacillus jejuensis TaxID=914327 RepID=UPI000D390F90
MYSLAAVLSAVMSTISSQLIVTSSALVEDLYKAFNKTPKSDSYYVFLGRLAVFFVSVGAVVTFVWGKAKWLGLYEIIPGFFLGLLAIVVVSLLTYRPNKEIDETFDAAIAHLKEEMKK